MLQASATSTAQMLRVRFSTRALRPPMCVNWGTGTIFEKSYSKPLVEFSERLSSALPPSRTWWTPVGNFAVSEPPQLIAELKPSSVVGFRVRANLPLNKGAKSMQIFLFFVMVTGLLAQDRAPKPVVEKDQLKQGRELLQRAQRAMGGAEKLAAVKDAMH